MTQANDTTRVFIPLTQRRRNGRARIVPPEPGVPFQSRSQDPHILTALGPGGGGSKPVRLPRSMTLPMPRASPTALSAAWCDWPTCRRT
ncbi:hypothetical protein [Aestuariivirga sp.]|jgi:hypothetical protein|uniref:hypothetical protein n=1 Tax=Aestuariivirga sp. TaxID=2650926 RepID=UPI0037844C7D